MPYIDAMLHSLDREGFVILEDLLDAHAIARIAALFDTSADATGTLHIPLGSEITAGIADHPRVLDCVRHILQRDFAVQHISGRNPLPGFGLQGLHTDWYVNPGEGAFVAATALWLLDDFTKTNGATRVVPRSHLDPAALPKQLRQPDAHHPHEQVVVAKAGSVLVFNGHLWHGGTRNQSNGPRRVIQCQYVIRDALRAAT